MKTILVTILAVLIAVPAFAAGDRGGVAFALYSGASSVVRTSNVYKVGGYKTKSMQVSGATLTSNASSITFKNMSGTAIVECAPSTTGPWSTCSTIGAGQHASITTNDIVTWEDAAEYVRFKWTASTVGTKLKVFLNWLED